MKPEVARWYAAQSIRLEPSAPDTQAQNRGVERSGGVIKDKARTMRLEANLPWEMWPEIVRAAVYLHNRTPRSLNDWRSPYDVFFTCAAQQAGFITPRRKPNEAYLKAYGCKAFALRSDTLRGKSRLQRLDPRAWIGYLVGYRSSNIYRIWVPSMAKVISTRDVIVNEDEIFSGKTEDLMDNLMHSTLDEISTWIRSVELPEPTHAEPETQSFYEDDTVMEPEATSEPSDQLGYSQGRKVGYIYPYPTPPSTPPPVALLTNLLSHTLRRSAKRLCRPTTSRQSSPNAPDGRCLARIITIGTYRGKTINKAQLKRIMAQGLKPYLNQLPPLPETHSRLEDHPLCQWFKDAELEHLESHYKMDSWSEVPAKRTKAVGHQILNCIWVYTYKLDKNHHLLKCKARS